MRLFEFNILPEDQIKNTIDTHCSEIMKIYKQTQKVLYRGISGADRKPISFISQSREDRRPMSTNQPQHDAINNKLKETGFKARRDNSIFCYSDRLYTGLYGSPYVIFPLNGFNFTYSKYNDLTTQMTFPSFNSKEQQDFLASNANRHWGSYIEYLINKQPIDEFINEHGFKNTDLSQALTLSAIIPEILINGKYLALRYGPYKSFIEELLGFEI